MDNQLIQFPASKQRFIIFAVAIAMTASLSFLVIYWQQNSDPYVQEVLTVEGDLTRGEAIFQINCSGCHALNTVNSVGPNLHGIAKRKSRTDIIKQVISGRTPPMPKFQPSSEEMAHLLQYLQSL